MQLFVIEAMQRLGLKVIHKPSLELKSCNQGLGQGPKVVDKFYYGILHQVASNTISNIFRYPRTKFKSNSYQVSSLKDFGFFAAATFIFSSPFNFLFRVLEHPNTCELFSQILAAFSNFRIRFSGENMAPIFIKIGRLYIQLLRI